MKSQNRACSASGKACTSARTLMFTITLSARASFTRSTSLGCSRAAARTRQIEGSSSTL
jgi:hypothetical protein